MRSLSHGLQIPLPDDSLSWHTTHGLTKRPQRNADGRDFCF